jgi:hypothetical protein
MRRVLGALALCVLSFTISPSWAQTEPRASAPTSAQQLIDQSNATGVFEALPSEQLIAVRHERSGLVCRLDPNNTNRLIIFPQAARGEDVACDSTDGTESVTLYATRYSFEATLDELMRGAGQAIRQRFPDARELPAPADAASAMPASRSAHFMVTRPDGAVLYTRITVAMVGQWAIKLRYTVVAPDADTTRRGEAAAISLWTATISELTQTRT